LTKITNFSFLLDKIEVFVVQITNSSHLQK